jgi:hypothetical protein
MNDKTRKVIEAFLWGPKFSKRDDKLALVRALKELINQYSYNHLHIDGDHGLDVINVRHILKLIKELEE